LNIAAWQKGDVILFALIFLLLFLSRKKEGHLNKGTNKKNATAMPLDVYCQPQQ